MAESEGLQGRAFRGYRRFDELELVADVDYEIYDLCANYVNVWKFLSVSS